eukprot:1101398-Pyramimonas_sp.AAC.1
MLLSWGASNFQRRVWGFLDPQGAISALFGDVLGRCARKVDSCPRTGALLREFRLAVLLRAS